jgi:hypothetical protein
MGDPQKTENAKRQRIKMTERDVTRAVRELLKNCNIWHFKHWGGPMSPKGVADILGCYQGRMLAIELKAPGNRPTRDQSRFLERVKAEGGIAFWADSVDRVVEELKLQGVRLL